jgi:hypothetical protein
MGRWRTPVLGLDWSVWVVRWLVSGARVGRPWRWASGILFAPAQGRKEKRGMVLRNPYSGEEAGWVSRSLARVVREARQRGSGDVGGQWWQDATQRGNRGGCRLVVRESHWCVVWPRKEGKRARPKKNSKIFKLIQLFKWAWIVSIKMWPSRAQTFSNKIWMCSELNREQISSLE